MDDKIWDSLVEVFKCVKNEKREGRTITGEIHNANNNDDLADFIEIEKDKITIYTEAINEKLLGCRVFFRKKEYDTLTKDKVFIFEGKLSSEEPDDRAYFNGLKWYNEFIEKIKSEEIANCVTNDIIYFHEQKGIKLPLTIPFDCLHNFSSQEKLLDTLLYKDHHQLEKISIFKQMLINRLIDIPEIKRPVEIVKISSTISGLFEADYKTYLNDFSATKILNDIKKESLDFTKQLQSLVIETGNKLIAIPTAYILLGTQSQKLKSLLSNGISVIGAFLFSLALITMLLIQLLNLISNKKMIKNYKEEKSQIIPNETKHIEKLFKPLFCRLNIMIVLTCLFIPISFFLFVIALIIFPIFDGMENIFDTSLLYAVISY